MSKALFEKISKLYAGLSDAYEALAAGAPAKGKAAAAEADDADDADDADMPAAKTAGTKGKPAAKKAPAKKVVEEDPEDEVEGDADDEGDAPTEDDVVAAAQALIKALGTKDKAIAIIKKHGGKKVADLDADVYADVIADFTKAMPKGKKAAADDTDDI